MVVHPEVGKWIIALGEKGFGMDPFGWRIAAAVVGSLMVLLMCRFVRRVTGSTALGLVGGLLLAMDGLQLVLSRLALLDIFLAFFILLGVHCVVADRQWFRARLAKGATRGLFRPWLLAAGVAFGLAVGTKWTAMFPLAAFGLLLTAWNYGARRAFGHPRALLKALLLDGPVAFASLVLVALVVYVASWSGLADPRQRVRAVDPEQLAVHDVRRRQGVGDGEPARRRGPRRGQAVAALAVGLPPGRLHLPHALPQRQHPPLRLQADGLAAAEPTGRRRLPARHRSRGRRAATRRRAPPACGRSCCSATR